MLENNFMTSMIKSEGHLLGFFQRPLAATLGVLALAVWLWPLGRGVWNRRHGWTGA
jgi:TctA family transporter